MSDDLPTMVEREVVSRPIVSVSDLAKAYASGLQALKDINLEIRCGEIFALLGPNGAGKTTLINIICGIVNPDTAGRGESEERFDVASLRPANVTVRVVDPLLLVSGVVAAGTVGTAEPEVELLFVVDLARDR